MDVRQIALTANTPARLIVPFRFFMLIETGGALDVKFLHRNSLSLIDEIGRSVEAGYKKKPLNPADVEERWGGYELLSTSNQTVTVGVSNSEGDYNRLVQVFEIEAPDDIASAADVNVGTGAEVEIVASNANRKAVYLYNTGSGQIRVRESLGGATVRGAPIPPGTERKLTTKGAVYGISESGTNAITVLEEVTT